VSRSILLTWPKSYIAFAFRPGGRKDLFRLKSGKPTGNLFDRFKMLNAGCFCMAALCLTVEVHAFNRHAE
jgi:hypothetical protein